MDRPAYLPDVMGSIPCQSAWKKGSPRIGAEKVIPRLNNTAVSGCQGLVGTVYVRNRDIHRNSGSCNNGCDRTDQLAGFLCNEAVQHLEVKDIHK